MIPYVLVERLFNQSVPGDAIPEEAWKRLEEWKRNLDPDNKAPDALKHLSEEGILTAANSLIVLWEEDWARENPQKAETIQRYEKMFYDEFGRADVVSEENVDGVANRANTIIESEEPGLEDRYFWTTQTQKLFVARRMEHLLKQNGVPVPRDISRFIADTETILRRGKEKE